MYSHIKTRLTTLVFTGLVAAAGVLATGAASAAQWTGYTYASVPTTSAVKGLKRMTRQIDEATDGKVDIKLHLGGTLHIDSSNITQAVGAGVIQFASDGFFLGNVPIGSVLRMPMLINDDDQWNEAVQTMRPYLEQGFAKQGVVYLGGYRYPVNTIFTTFPIHSLADLAGHKIRVTAPEQAHFLKQFDAIPVQLSGSEVPTALERSVVDGVITASAGGAKKWHDMLDYNYRLGVSYFNSAVIANKHYFDQLPADTQAKIREIVQKECAQITQDFEADEKVQMQAQKNGGMKIVMPSDAEVAKATDAMQPYWPQWAKERGPEFVKALEEVRAAMGSTP